MRIDLAHGSEAEAATRDQLSGLMGRHDLSPWEFTDTAILALLKVIGTEEADRAMEFWQSDHYTAIYRTIIEHGDAIDRILHKHDLIPM